MPSSKKLSPILIVMTFCMALIGCGLKEGVIQKDSASYVLFTGNTRGALVYIDDLPAFSPSNEYEPEKTIHHQVAPGKHRVIVKQQGKTVVKRIVLLEKGVIKEIRIP